MAQWKTRSHVLSDLNCNPHPSQYLSSRHGAYPTVPHDEHGDYGYPSAASGSTHRCDINYYSTSIPVAVLSLTIHSKFSACPTHYLNTYYCVDVLVTDLFSPSTFTAGIACLIAKAIWLTQGIKKAPIKTSKGYCSQNGKDRDMQVDPLKTTDNTSLIFRAIYKGPIRIMLKISAPSLLQNSNKN